MLRLAAGRGGSQTCVASSLSTSGRYLEPALPLVPLGIPAAGGHQLLMTAALDNPSMREHQDLVQLLQPTQAVADDDERPPARLVEKVADEVVGGGQVEVFGRLVQHQHRKVGQEHAGQG